MLPKILLLLVEDDLTIRSMLEEALEEAGYAVTAAQNGSEAIKLLDQQRGELKGLITDIDLGEGPEGWDVARHARELCAEMPVVYMSGASAHHWTSHGVPKSVLVAKPFAPAQIITAISTLLNNVPPA